MRITSVEKLKDQGSSGSPAYEFATKIAFEKLSMAASDWVGGTVWGSPLVALAPPYTLKKQLNNVYVRECSSRAAPYVLLGVSLGAREAMISFWKIYEKKNVLQKIRTSPQAA